MPKNTKVHRCVDELRDDPDVDNPYAVCQASTGQSFATGKKIKNKSINPFLAKVKSLRVKYGKCKGLGKCRCHRCQ